MTRSTLHSLILAFAVTFQVVNAQSDFGPVKRDVQRHISAGRYGEAISLLTRFVTENPSVAEAYQLRGTCYENRSQLENAVRDYRKAAELDPSNVTTNRSLARTERALTESMQKNIEGYKRELARNPSSGKTYLEIAQAYVLLENWAEAETWYDQFVKRATPSPEHIKRYAEILARNNHLAKGEAMLRQYAGQHPNEPGLWSELGYFLLWLGKFKEAQATFERVLATNPSLAEAREGLRQARLRGRPTTQRETSLRDGTPQLGTEFPVDKYISLLRDNPGDEEMRYRLTDELVKVQRFDEAFRQLDTLALGFADTVRVREVRQSVTLARDSVVHSKIAQYELILREDPSNMLATLRVAEEYGLLGEYRTAIRHLDRYLKDANGDEKLDVRFTYAQFAAWAGMYDTSLAAVNFLLKAEPGNPDYQLLRGQLSVWMEKDLDDGLRYLNNVLRRSPNNMNALVAASSALARKKDFAGARAIILRAKRLDSTNAEVQRAERFLGDALRADAESRTFAALTRAREMVTAGECEKAIAAYENYLSMTGSSDRRILLEYADAQSCAKHLDRAISVYDTLLKQEYDFDIALLRAKNLLWSGDSLEAIREFTRLTKERPDDFNTRLYLGDSYANVRQFSRARDTYESLLAGQHDEGEQDMVRERLRLLPPTGVWGALTAFPTRVALSPPAFFYSDNQDFELANYGARLELGLSNNLSLALFAQQTFLQSSSTHRHLKVIKGQMFARLSQRITLSGAIGTLLTPGRASRLVGDASFAYEKSDEVKLSGYVEVNDGAALLFSPYLIDLHYTGRLLHLTAWYVTKPKILIAGAFKSIAVSDGNNGNELQLRIGPKLLDEIFLGYEYLFTDFTKQAPYVPFTDHTRQIYYTPQNLESHSLWVAWTPQKDEDVTVNLRGKIGYVPAFRARVRELAGDLEYRPLPLLVLTGSLTAGSNIRFDSSYNYVSVALSAYVRLH